MEEIASLQSCRFADAPLWTLQRRYFEERGIKAWQEREVPEQITSSPVMAKAIAETVLAFFRDRARLFPGMSEPVYLLEPGGGSGKFAFRFLKYLETCCEEAAFEVPPYCYVLSDFVQANVDYWKEHPRLQPFIISGHLDFARFDAISDTAIYLQHSGTWLTAGSLRTPIVVIANYFFDSIPQDLFYIKNKSLYEARVCLRMPADYDTLPPANVLEKLEGEYHLEKTNHTYYPEASFNALLEQYANSIDETYLFFPHNAIRCLQQIQGWTEGGLLLLTADKGSHREEKLAGRQAPLLNLHGSFSLSVNFHAIKTWFAAAGAETWCSIYDYSQLNLLAIVQLPDATQYKETAAGYRRYVLNNNPDDLYNLKTFFFRHFTKARIAPLLSFLKINGHDPELLAESIPRLLQLAPHFSDDEKEDLLYIVCEAWELYYPIGEKSDFAFQLGVLLYQVHLFQEALAFFEHSAFAFGASAPALYNMASCYYQLNDFAAARTYALQTLALEPGHAGAGGIFGEVDGR